MAKVQDINNAFLTVRSKNDIEIEKATRKNINRIEDSDVIEIHQNLLKVLNVKSKSESQYFDLIIFNGLISRIRKEIKEKEEKKKATVTTTNPNNKPNHFGNNR